MKLPIIVRNALSHRCDVLSMPYSDAKIIERNSWWYITDSGVEDIKIALQLSGINQHRIGEILIDMGNNIDDPSRWQVNIYQLNRSIGRST